MKKVKIKKNLCKALLVVTILIVSISVGIAVGMKAYTRLEAEQPSEETEVQSLVINEEETVKRVRVYGPDQELLFEATGKVELEEATKEIVIRFSEQEALLQHKRNITD